MRKKKPSTDEEGRAWAELTAGCPFNNFGPCKTEKCTFFIASDPALSERECIIKTTHFRVLMDSLYIAMGLLGGHAPLENLPPQLEKYPREMFFPTLTLRLTESVVSTLRNLEGLAVHPKTSPTLKKAILKLRTELYSALKTFAEGKNK